MQPSSSTGRKARMALLPLSWFVAFATAAVILLVVAMICGVTIRQLLQTDSPWMLALILPSLAFGKVLGLILINLSAYITPLRRVFEKESRDTGRKDFATATFGLVRLALILFLLTVVGAVAFLSFTQ